MPRAQIKQSTTPTETAKRGRGRPRAENPLSAAERARRYRENQRKKAEAVNIRDVTKNSVTQSGKAAQLASENAALRRQVEQLAKDLHDTIGAVELFIDYRQKKKSIPADIFRNLCESHLKIALRNAKTARR